MKTTVLLLCDVTPLDDPVLYARLYDGASAVRRAAADAFRFRKDRNLSLGATALLDRGLAAYGLREKDMKYGFNGYGKPFFLNAPEIHFSISHSGTMVAVAFSGEEVGCDIERIADFDPELARQALSPEEYDAVTAEDGPEGRSREFFRFWTLKESYMKAMGTGLSIPPQSFSVLHGMDGFSFMSPEPIPGYACALCFRPGSAEPGVEHVSLSLV